MLMKILDEYGLLVFNEFGVVLVFMKEYNFLGFICISVNYEVCYGILSYSCIFQEGDLVNIDVFVEVDGYYVDNGGFFVLGKDM